MALLKVTPEMLAQSLFQGAAPSVEITGAAFDHERGIVLLRVEGPGVPEAGYVEAIFTQKRFEVTFQPIAK